MKSQPGKDEDAKDQLKKSKGAFMNSGFIKKVDSDSGNLTKDDFERDFKNIDRYTMGPKDADSYDETFDLTEDELVALMKTILDDEYSS